MKTIRIAAVALLVLAAAALAGVGRPDSAGGVSAQSGGITVNGVGTVDSVPDEAEMSFGVQTEGATSRQALARNSAQMERVLSRIEAGQIEVNIVEDNRSPASRRMARTMRRGSALAVGVLVMASALAAGVILMLNALTVPAWFCLGLAGVAALRMLFVR